MSDNELLADQFEANRSHLRAVAYRMLGSATEADDAVQEAWIRLSRSDTSDVQNLTGWLTTVTSRVCLDMLRSRSSRREEPIDDRPSAPLRSIEAGVDPEEEAELADSVGLALLVVLETLPPAERLAFVLHDMFAVSFDEIAPIVGRTPTAARQLASRARRRVQGAPAAPESDRARRTEIVEAFLAASRGGEFDSLLAILDPDVVLRVDAFAGGGNAREVVGAGSVAKQARAYRTRVDFARSMLIDGEPGLVLVPRGRLQLTMAFTITDDKVTALEIIADPDRLAGLELAVLKA